MRFIKYTALAVVTAVLIVFSGCADKEVDKINSYIEKTKDFEGGKLDYDTKEYSSDYWNLEFEFDDEWVIQTPEQMQYLADSSHDSVVAAGLKALQKENAGEDYINAYEKSVRIVPEFAADHYLGEALGGTVLGYSIIKYSGETESIENVVPGMRAVMENGTIKQHEVTICGEKYTAVEGVMARYREETDAVIFAREKDGVYFVIMIGFYDDGSTVDAFLEMVE